MMLKPGLLGLLTFTALACAVMACATRVLGLRRLGEAFFAAGFAAAAGAIGVRWSELGHPPLKNLFEIFLCLGAAVYPLSLLCRRALGSDSQATDALIAGVVLVPAVFVFPAGEGGLPPALQSPLFIPHVASYLLAYVVMAMAGVSAWRTLAALAWGAQAQAEARELATFRLVRLGLPLMTLGLVLGAFWGKLAWGDWWNWDPKELWSLAGWLVFVGYLHARKVWRRRRALNSVIVLTGALLVAITLVWVNLSRLFQGLHNYAS